MDDLAGCCVGRAPVPAPPVLLAARGKAAAREAQPLSSGR